MKQIATAIPSDLANASSEIDEFEGFWSIYPRKTNKAKAKISFNRLSAKDKHNCLIGAKRHADHNPQWKDPSKIPHATTFINGARWEDDIVEQKNGTDRVQETQTDSPVDMVWSALAQMYPSIFVAKYGEKPLPVWRSQLKNIPMERLQRGLKMTLHSKSDFPPSLPTFMVYCAQRFDEETAQPKLPKPECTQEVALNAIAEMRSILGRSAEKE
jgi:hypothetical protein